MSLDSKAGFLTRSLWWVPFLFLLREGVECGVSYKVGGGCPRFGDSGVTERAISVA